VNSQQGHSKQDSADITVHGCRPVDASILPSLTRISRRSMPIEMTHPERKHGACFKTRE
jgi:hypothetical protein